MDYYDQYQEFCKEAIKKQLNSEDFFNQMIEKFNINYYNCMDLWYYEQRSRCTRESFNEAMRMAVQGEKLPHFMSGADNFVDGKFV